MTTTLIITGVVTLGLLMRKLLKAMLADQVRKTWELE